MTPSASSFIPVTTCAQRTTRFRSPWTGAGNSHSRAVLSPHAVAIFLPSGRAIGDSPDAALMTPELSQFFSRRRIPEAGCFVHASRQYGFSIRTEGHGHKNALMSQRRAEGVAGAHLPEPDRLIQARREDRFPVGGEGNACDGATVQQHRQQRLAGLGLPEAECLVHAPGGDDLSVRAECHGKHIVLMHERFADRLVRGHIPSLCDVDADTGKKVANFLVDFLGIGERLLDFLAQHFAVRLRSR